MKRFVAWAGAVLGVLLLGFVAFFFWASSGGLSEEKLATTKGYPAEATAPGDTVTVMTYNIGYLSGMTNNEPVVRSDRLFTSNMDQAVALLRADDPDVVGFQEIDFGGARVKRVHQLDTLGTRLGYPMAAQAVNWDERYLPFPYGRPAVHFGRTISGQAVLSRPPIRQHTRTVLSRPPNPFFRDAFYLNRLAQTTVIDVGGRPLAVINLHLEAYDVETREKQAREVLALYNRLTAQSLPVLLIGDFNSEVTGADDASAANSDRPTDETARLLLNETGLRAVFPDTVEGTPPATFPADAPTRKIDYILYPPEQFVPVDRTVRCGTPSPPSDHCAVVASFRFRSSPADWPAPNALPRLDTLLTD